MYDTSKSATRSLIITQIPSSDVDAFLANHQMIGNSAWAVREGKLNISLKFHSFLDAFAFMTSVVLYAEREGHHPEWTNIYNRVDISLTTHEASGITQRDLNLANYINRVYTRYV